MGIQIFLGAIGMLTLLIAGVGVANVMYVVVKERTREIGIKMALGARRRVILSQFLFESLLIAFIGGIIGPVPFCGHCLCRTHDPGHHAGGPHPRNVPGAAHNLRSYHAHDLRYPDPAGPHGWCISCSKSSGAGPGGIVAVRIGMGSSPDLRTAIITLVGHNGK